MIVNGEYSSAGQCDVPSITSSLIEEHIELIKDSIIDISYTLDSASA